jgi:hypothetical protein
MPTLRRLKYLVKWGHWQLIDYEEAPAEWRWTVLDEVVKPFLPWIQRMHLVGGGDLLGEEVSTDMREVLKFLVPLYIFLQRRAVSEALMSACSAVTVAMENGSLDQVDMDRCRFLFPIVLETIIGVERLDSRTFEQLLRETSATRRGLFSSHHEPRRNRLQQITQALTKLLERPEVLRAVQEPPFSCNSRTDRCSAGASESVSEGSGSETLGEHSAMPSLTSFLEGVAKAPPPLVLPPVGAEDESGLSHPDDGAEEDEYYSLSGSDDETEHRSGGLAHSVSSSRDPRTMCFADRQASFPIGEGNHTWRGFEENTFDVRSESYLKDRRKAPSGPALFEAVNMEIVLVGSAGPAWRVATHRDFFPQFQRRRGDKRFFVVHNWVFPPYQAVFIGALDPAALWHQDQNSPQARLWRRFLEMSREERQDIFKVIISINEGPWLVKRAAPKRPVIIGRKVLMNTFYEPGDHVEFVMDINTSRAEQMAVSIVMKALKGLQVSLSTLLEARHQDELPETLLFCGAVKYMDLSKSGAPEVDPECHQRDWS